jgi:hypothetical protein
LRAIVVVLRLRPQTASVAIVGLWSLAVVLGVELFANIAPSISVRATGHITNGTATRRRRRSRRSLPFAFFRILSHNPVTARHSVASHLIVLLNTSLRRSLRRSCAASWSGRSCRRLGGPQLRAIKVVRFSGRPVTSRVSIVRGWSLALVLGVQLGTFASPSTLIRHGSSIINLTATGSRWRSRGGGWPFAVGIISRKPVAATQSVANIGLSLGKTSISGSAGISSAASWLWSGCGVGTVSIISGLPGTAIRPATSSAVIDGIAFINMHCRICFTASSLLNR